MASDDEGGLDLFQEPEGFYEPEKPPTYATHKMLSGEEIRVRLVGFNPLWVSSACSSICSFSVPCLASLLVSSLSSLFFLAL